MTTLRELFTAFAPASLERYPTLPTSHRKVSSALQPCRSGHDGQSLSQCPSCGPQHRVNHSCGHRHCPQCPQHQTQQWVHHPLEPQLPGPPFLITFTVPATLRPFLRAHHRLASHALCPASSEARTRLAKDARCIGTTLPGLPGVLPPWGRQLPDHPHLHDSVPGGGLAQEREAWLPARAPFYVPVRALSPSYRALFPQERRTSGQLAQIDPHVWHIPWNVHSQATPDGAPSCTSLAPDVFKVAIAPRRIVALQERIVTCTDRKPGSSRPRTTRRAGLELMRRFRQPGLPAGFMQVRPCGWRHATCRVPTATIRQMMPAPPGAPLEQPRRTATTPAPVTCPHCGAPLLVLRRVWPFHVALFDTG